MFPVKRILCVERSLHAYLMPRKFSTISCMKVSIYPRPSSWVRKSGNRRFTNSACLVTTTKPSAPFADDEKNGLEVKVVSPRDNELVLPIRDKDGQGVIVYVERTLMMI